MVTKHFHFEFEEYSSDKELIKADYDLLQSARYATHNAYAPYSKFLVGAAALLANNEVIGGSNQENASFPTGICAERVLLASASQIYPNIGVRAMAITYNNLNGSSDLPVTPCGFCRQVMTEYETRMQMPMRLIISGISGTILVIPSVSMLLPLGFFLKASD